MNDPIGIVFQDRRKFWREAFAWKGSVTPLVLPSVLAFGLIAIAVCTAAWLLERQLDMKLGLEIAPFEIAGAALGLLLILRTNAGYDRWWEARKLWGGIVNQSRNLVIDALAYGPSDPEWKEQFTRWAAVYPHIARSQLRGAPPSLEVAQLVGPVVSAQIAMSPHMPSFVALQLAHMLREACDAGTLDRFAFLQLDRERAALIDHLGACERILKTPLPMVYAIKIRRFLAVFLITLPFALLHQLQAIWLIPLITMMVAYPLVSLDQIGVELQNPFSLRNLGHLPLDDISRTIEQNLMGLLRTRELLPVDSLTPPSPREAFQTR